jgi:hypothetical protein
MPSVRSLLIFAASTLLACIAFPCRVSACDPVSLAWDASQEGDVVAYIVSYRFDGGGSVGSLTVNAPATSATVGNLSCGALYHFKVSAVNHDGLVGMPSDEVAATTGPADPSGPISAPVQPAPPSQPPPPPPPPPPLSPPPTAPEPTPAPFPFGSSAPLTVNLQVTTPQFGASAMVLGDFNCVVVTNYGPEVDALIVYRQRAYLEVARSTRTIAASSQSVDCRSRESWVSDDVTTVVISLAW